MSAPWLSEGHPPPTRRSMGGGMGGGARAPCFRQVSTGGSLHDLPAPPWPVDQPLGASWAWRPRVVGTERFSPTRPLSCGENAFPQLDEASCGNKNASWARIRSLFTQLRSPELWERRSWARIRFSVTAHRFLGLSLPRVCGGGIVFSAV